jgi:hypothetical protein
MGRIKVMTGEAPLQATLTGTFVEESTSGTASDIFASKVSLVNLEGQAVLLRYLQPSTQSDHSQCLLFDGGNASSAICHLEAPTNTPVIPAILTGTGTGTGTEDSVSSDNLVIDIIDPINTLTSRSNDPAGTIAFSNDTRQIVVFKDGGYDTWTETSN